MGQENSKGNKYLAAIGLKEFDEKKIREVFDKYDADKNGALDAQEAALFLRDISPKTKDDLLSPKSSVGVSDAAVIEFFATFGSSEGSVTWEALIAKQDVPQPYQGIRHKEGIERHLLQEAGVGDKSYNSFSNCPVYGSDAMTHGAPDDEIPDDSLPPKVAYQLIHDELETDGKPRLNLATFVTTYMEKEAEDLMMEGLKINAIDMDEYQSTTAIHQRCVNMIARLFNAPLQKGQKATGTGCLGSSEAIMLATLAMKWRWKAWRKSKGLAIDKPNIIMGANVQVCWHKACKYFEIEAREAAVSKDALVLTAERVAPLIDDNTIGVCPILGSTFNGEFEDVKGIHDLVAAANEGKGWQIPIHVDAASGGFIAPFTDPDLLWDFRLPWVKSINTSGHKFGLVYAGMGWALWRERCDLPEDLIFHVNYLGGDQASFTLNFSRPGSHFVGQYYNLIRFGKKGYKALMLNGQRNAAYLRESLRTTGRFDIVDKGHMPLVAFALNAEANPHKITVFELQERLRMHGWIVPAYTCPTGATDLAIMRVVVKQNFSRNLADLLVRDILNSLAGLEKEHKALEATVRAATAGVRFQGSVHKALRRSLQAKGSEAPKDKGTGNPTGHNGVC